MARTVCFSAFTLAGRAQAMVLAESVRAAHPDWELHALLVDAAAEEEGIAGFDVVVPVAHIGIPRFPGWIFRHEPAQATLAARACMLRHMLAGGADRVVSLSPDIAVFHPLGLAEGDYAGASVLLTPHQCAPNDDPRAIRDNERVAMRRGIYNLGFLAVRNDAPGRGFAQWLAEMMLQPGYDGRINPEFADQIYCNLAPAMFDNVVVIRDPGYHAAAWNLSTRRLAFQPDGRITANGAPLRFYHFGEAGGADILTERYAGENVEVFELTNWHRRSVACHAETLSPAGQWAYAGFDDGTPITPAMRQLWRGRHDLQAAFANPFAAGPGTLRAWLRRERPDLLES